MAIVQLIENERFGVQKAQSIEQQCATYTPRNVMLLMTEAPTPNIAYNNYSHTAYNCPPNITTKPHQRVSRTKHAEINRENNVKIQISP